MNRSCRLVSLLALALLVSIAGVAHADVNAFWKQLGGSASGKGVSQTPAGNTSVSPWVAVGANGNPVVAYAESVFPGAGSGKIIVKRWNGTSFVTLSGAGGIGVGFDPQVQIAPNGALYVAWIQTDSGSNQVHLLRQAVGSSTFAPLGTSNSPGGLTALNQSAFSFSLGVGADNNPIVAFDTLAQTGTLEPTPGFLQDESQVYVKRFNSVSGLWEYLGTDPSTGGGASNAASFSVDGGAAFARHSAFGPSLAVQDDGGVIVAFQYATEYTGAVGSGFVANNSEIFVTRFFNASTWMALGPAVPQMDDSAAARGGAGGVSANTLISGPPSLASRDDQTWVTWAEGDNVYARRFAVMAWVELSGSASGNGISDPTFPNIEPRGAIDALGRPVVVWNNAPPSAPESQIFVKRGESAFVEMGPNSASGDGISAANIGSGNPMIATPPSGSAGPVAVWSDVNVVSNATEVFLRQFSTAAAFSLTVVLNGANGSTVTSTPPGIACPGDCSDTFPSGTLVGLAANPAPGQRLLGFTGCTSVAGNLCNVTMTANRTVNASFVNTFALTVTKLGTGASFARITAPAVGGGALINCGGNCSSVYNAGTTVALTIGTLPATTAFNGWGGDCAFRLKNTSCSLPVNAARAVSATFTQTLFSLTLNPTTAAGPTATGSRIDGINPDFDCFVGSGPCSTLVDAGTLVQLLVAPAANQRVIPASLTSTPATLCKTTSSNTSCAFTMSANSTINAGFRQVTQLLINRTFGNQANRSANYVVYGGNGFAGSTLDCGGGVTTRTDCSGLAFTNSSVTMTAFVAAGSILDPDGTNGCTWAGTGTTRTCTYIATGQNQSINISYTQVKRLLSVTGATGTTQGFAISTPAGIDCGNFAPHLTQCSALFDHGTQVSLEPFPGTDSRFDRWVSGCSGIITNLDDPIRPICRVNMTANVTVTKNFVTARTLFLSAAGNGQGKITTNTAPAPSLVCDQGLGSSCSVSRLVSTNSSVVLTPTAATGSNFRWLTSDCPSPGGSPTGPCTLRMSANKSGIGQFLLNVHGLNVARTGNGSIVSTNLVGDIIDCSTSTTDCTTNQDFGTLIGLQATNDIGFRFTTWTGTSPCSVGAQATNRSCFFQIKGNVTTIANFRPTTAVTLFKTGNAPNSNGQGTLTAMGTLGTGPLRTTPASTVTCGLTCGNTSFSSFDGKLVKLSAAPSLGSNFAGFTGACMTTNASCSFTPSGDNVSVTGQFVLQQFGLTVTNRQNGTVTSTAPAGAINCGFNGSDCTETLNFGTAVTLLVTPNSDFIFVNWTGDPVCAGKTTPTCSFTNGMPNRAVTVTPNYRARTLATLFKTGNAPNSNGQGTLTATGTLGIGPAFTTPASTVTCGLTCGNTSFSAFDGKLVKLSAAPSLGSNFAGFTGACTTTNASCSFTPGGDNVSVTGQFVLQQFLLTVGNSSRGTVVSTAPMGAIDCGTLTTDCNEILNFSTPVSLAATADPGFVFVNWTGDAVCNGKTTPTCSFPTMPNRNVTVTPNYRARTVVNVNKTGNGAGTVKSVPAGIDCGSVCSDAFFNVVAVTVTATVSTGSTFGGFSGACTSGNSSCTFTPSGNSQNVSALFTLSSFNLSVTQRFNGTVVSTSPMGAINCGGGNNSDCSEILNFGTAVALAADPNDGNIFRSWKGDAVCASKTTPTCSFTMPNRPVTVEPDYRLSTLLNVVKIGGAAAGTVTSTPAGITCGTDCSERYFDGASVKLTATENTGFNFLGFSGACVSNTSTCTFVPTGDTATVNATYAAESRTVNVTVNGDGQVVAGMIGCDSDTNPCDFTGDFGSTIVFSVVPDNGNRIISLTGCTSQSSNLSSCSVALNQATGNKSLTVTFSFLMSVAKFGDGAGTVTSTPAGITCGTDCSQQYTPGVVVTLNRAAAAGSTLGPWGDDCAFRGTNASCQLSMTQNHFPSAAFFGPQPLTVTLAGGGNGSVTSSPTGITCPGDCSQSYAFGTQVTLTPTAANGSVFTSFTGCDSTPTNTSCVVSMSGNRSVTATFDVMITMSHDAQPFVASATVTVPAPAVAVEPMPVALVSRAARLEARLFDRIRRFIRRA